MTTITEILEKYRRTSSSERDKGDRFERLMRAFLLTDRRNAPSFENVWLWKEFPFNKQFKDGHDLGIDLVAKTKDGEYWSVQCKFYSEDTCIDKKAVDSFLGLSTRSFYDGKSVDPVGFSRCLWIATTDHWNENAWDEFHSDKFNLKMSMLKLEDLKAANVDWDKLEKDIYGEKAVDPNSKELLPHQEDALNAVHEYFKTPEKNRAQLIMACGTGKTFTSLRIAENETNGKGLILFLVPSIALLGQALSEWTGYAIHPIKSICVCSDSKVSEQKRGRLNDYDQYKIAELAVPVSTDVKSIVDKFKFLQEKDSDGMTVIFSTYQSMEQVAKAQDQLNNEKPESCIFDLIVCDEAHRTTGYKQKKQDGSYDESAYIRVHNNDFIQSKKRLYMTATPRIYKINDEKTKGTDPKNDDVLYCSMDDKKTYGEIAYEITFGQAVHGNLLSDYKVLVLATPEDGLQSDIKKMVEKSNGELDLVDAAKLVGCINALSKRMVRDEELVKLSDPNLMRTAVAFCQNIPESKRYAAALNTLRNIYADSLPAEEQESLVNVESDHIDGSMNAMVRNDKLSWLKSPSELERGCRILTNVRCLSEGVDVPVLDAVIFLSSRKSKIEVAQSVGRVMRKAPEKNYGYIIIPVVIPPTITPEEALNNSDCFDVVWEVLNALRAHDKRFEAEINKLYLNNPAEVDITDETKKVKDSKITKTPNPNPNPKPYKDIDGRIIVSTALPEWTQDELKLKWANFNGMIYAQMVKKVGSRRYWEDWAKDVAEVAKNHIDRITRMVETGGKYRTEFKQFLGGLRKNLNPSVTEQETIEMLAQHLITGPVFEALFENYSFVKNNPVSIAMQKMVDILHEEIPEDERKTMARFYESVAERVSGIDNAEGRQKIIIELYDKFFKTAFPMVVEKLGIVYTPVEVVDFILNSVNAVLQKEFNRSISDEGVHVLDPFTGTGTFITRLLQSGLIKPEDLERKYRHEIHANEIVLLAYYIASINIENVYHDLTQGSSQYQEFPGICLTDTFQLGESEKEDDWYSEAFEKNSERVVAQKKTPIQIIVGNPPYSVGQRSANDNAQNQSYPHLEGRIAETYATRSRANNKNSLYDSYVKAFRWASDRLGKQGGGIIAFVSNGGWLDGSAMDGMRKCLEEEFSSIYVFNLRGNCRTSGELRRREKDNVFGLGSRTPIAITILVHNPEKVGMAKILYKDIGDYLTREQKLERIRKFNDILNPKIKLERIQPNDRQDWINLRDGLFDNFIPIGDRNSKEAKTIFTPVYSRGCESSRDSWVYNFSRVALEHNVTSMIDFYNFNVIELQQERRLNPNCSTNSIIHRDPSKISWTRNLYKNFEKAKSYTFSSENIKIALYRPFCRQNLYFSRNFNEYVNQWPYLFPTSQTKNLVICVSGIGVTKDFSTIITDCIPDLELIGKSQCFPLYYYKKTTTDHDVLFSGSHEEYNRYSGITDFIMEQTRMLNPKISHEDVFYFVYGYLHSPDYRQRFSNDLKKSLPRIQLPEDYETFKAFSEAGRELADLHLHYETGDLPKDVRVVGAEFNHFRVEKMRFLDKGDKSTIVYNNYIRIKKIPDKAYRYVVNGKSAIEWIMNQYAVTTDKASGIKNDPNEWDGVKENPRYILDLLLRIIEMSCRTMDIVDKLPHLEFPTVEGMTENQSEEHPAD